MTSRMEQHSPCRPLSVSWTQSSIYRRSNRCSLKAFMSLHRSTLSFLEQLRFACTPSVSVPMQRRLSCSRQLNSDYVVLAHHTFSTSKAKSFIDLLVKREQSFNCPDNWLTIRPALIKLCFALFRLSGELLLCFASQRWHKEVEFTRGPLKSKSKSIDGG